ncbi:hypothetical protein [Streptomyces sp. NPDC059979]|uniref:hypothetical protein n=1 Tax=Streptomyces sp. NPDC059979 TaxID=3347021 RepID=UPI00369A2135
MPHQDQIRPTDQPASAVAQAHICLLTAAGQALYVLPDPGSPLLAVAACVLAVVAAVWAAAPYR